MKKAIRISDSDNVATSLAFINVREKIEILSDRNESIGYLESLEVIPFGFKVAISDIEKEGYVVKYGVKVGKCNKLIQKGELVHIHNVDSQRITLPESVKTEVLAEINAKIRG